MANLSYKVINDYTAGWGLLREFNVGGSFNILSKSTAMQNLHF
jgi:hypothetical protein